MRQIQKSPVPIKYPKLRLYKPEFTKIIDIFKTNCQVDYIQINDYILDNLSELDELMQNITEITHLDIRTSKPYLHLNFNKSGAIISYQENTPNVRGILSMLNDEIMKGKTLYEPLSDTSYILSGIGFILFLIFSILKIRNDYTNVFVIFFFTSLVISGFFIFISIRHVKIYNKDKTNRSYEFITKNLDKIASAIIGGLILWGLTQLIPLIVNNLL